VIKQTGATYKSSQFAKALVAGDPKQGKSTYLIGAALGVLPWQTGGGIVDRPEHLHVITFDANALGGISRFLTESCKAPAEALNFNVYNMQGDVNAIGSSDQQWDLAIYNTFHQVLDQIGSAVKTGTHVVVISSLTGLAQAIERGLAGPPNKKGGGMDQAKWNTYNQQLSEIRCLVQDDRWHCIWEAHTDRAPETPGQATGPKPETIAVKGSSGRNFAFNVEQVFRVRRMFGKKMNGTPVEECYLDTRPTGDFISGGRGFTENLEPKENDPAQAFKKLGLQVGGWNAKAGAK
jgi:hypothetical protein